MSELKTLYEEPGMVVLDKKYVNEVDFGENSYYFFYQSGENIITISFLGERNRGIEFITWYYSRFSPN